MPRPRRPSYKLYVRLSDQATRAIQEQADDAGMKTLDLVEKVIVLYLDLTLDGLRPIHLHAMPNELKLRTYHVSQELGERLERIRQRMGFAVQDIARAAITEHLHIL